MSEPKAFGASGLVAGQMLLPAKVCLTAGKGFGVSKASSRRPSQVIPTTGHFFLGLMLGPRGVLGLGCARRLQLAAKECGISLNPRL